MASFFGVSVEALTAVGSESPGLREVKGGMVAVAVAAAADPLEVGGEAERDLSFLLRSWTPSWMLTMPRSVFVSCKKICALIFFSYYEHLEYSLLLLCFRWTPAKSSLGGFCSS